MSQDRRPPEHRVIDIANVKEFDRIASQLKVEPEELAQVVTEVGVNRRAAEVWLTGART